MKVLNSITEQDEKSGVLHVTDSEGCQVNVGYLRPKMNTPSILDDHKVSETLNAKLETNRIFHVGKIQELWNTALRDNFEFSAVFKGDMVWNIAGKIQRGLGWRERLKCTKCHFVSARHKLCAEVQTDRPGAKPTALNYGAQVGLV